MDKPHDSTFDLSAASSYDLWKAVGNEAERLGCSRAAVVRTILSAHFGVPLVHPKHGGARRGCGRKPFKMNYASADRWL